MNERMKGGTKERGMEGEWVGPGKGVCESGWKRGGTTRGSTESLEKGDGGARKRILTQLVS